MPLAMVNEARESIRKYDKQSEEYDDPLKVEDHETAVNCLDFEAFLAFGLSLARFIDRFDLAWRFKVHEGLIPYQKDIEDIVEALYKAWLHPCDRIVRRIEEFEKQGFQVSGAGDFRETCREVKGILTPDEDFFAGTDELVRLQEEAVAANRRGETVELKELSD